MNEKVKREVKEIHRLNSDIQNKANNYIEDLIKSIEYELEQFKLRKYTI